MKKRIIISLTILLIAATALIGGNYLLSFREVDFNILDKGNGEIYSSDDKVIAEVRSGEVLSLRQGKYYIVPTGENIADTKVDFEVKNENLTVTVNPQFTEEYLATLLKSEITSIKSATNAKYPELMPNFEFTSGKLYLRGEWYGGLLKPKVSDARDLRDPYKIILHKVDGKWEVIRRPEYVLTSSRYGQVPIEILRDINSIVE